MTSSKGTAVELEFSEDECFLLEAMANEHGITVENLIRLLVIKGFESAEQEGR